MASKRIERNILNMAAMAFAAILLLPALVSRSFADSGTVSIVSAAPASGVAGSSNTVVVKGLATLSPVTVTVGSSYFMPTVVGSEWTVNLNTVGMANGQYEITVKATDASGHTVSASKYLVIASGPTGRSFSLSGSAVPSLATPAATAQSAAAGVTLTPVVAITSPLSNATVSGSVRVAGTASETGGSVASVSVSVDGGAAAAATGTTSWSYTLNSTLRLNGLHTITATAKDAAGHLSAVKSVTVRTSNIPTVAIVSPALNATVSGTVNVTGTSAETGGTVQSVSVSVDGGAYAAASGTTNWSFSLNTTKLTNATHTIAVKSVDFGGNVSVIVSRTIRTSNVPPAPTVAITAPAVNASVSGSVNVTGTSAETGGTVKTVSVSVDGGVYAAASGTTNWSFALSTLALNLKNGAHTIYVKAVDTAGYSSAVQSRAIQVANLPTVVIASPANGAKVATVSSITGTAAAEPGGTLRSVTVSVDGAAAVTAAGTSSWSYALNLKAGAHTISVKATDTAGLSSAAQSVTISVVVAPIGSITSPAVNGTVSGAYKVAGSASETGGTVASVSVSVDGGAYAAASGTTNWSFLLSPTLTSGAHTLTAKIVDAAGTSYTTPSRAFTAENNVPVSGTLQVTGSNQCTTYTSNSCTPGAAWSGSASVCDTKGLGMCGTLKASGTGSQSVSQAVSLLKSGQTVGSVTVAGTVNTSQTTSCAQYDDPTQTCVTDPVWVCEPVCDYVPDTCYDSDNNPYDCGYYDCSQEDCYWDYSNETCTTTDNYYYQCTEKVSGSGTLTGTLQ